MIYYEFIAIIGLVIRKGSEIVMNKSEFAQKISYQTGVTQKEAMDQVNLMIDIMTDQLMQRGEIKLRGFGTFQAKKRSEKMMTNPQTMERIKIPERYVPVFIPGSVLRNAVKNGVR